MKKSNFYVLSGFLGLLVTTLVVSSVASADSLFPGRGQGPKINFDPAEHEQMMEQMQEEREAIQAAIDAGDYQAWKDIIDSRPRITDVITADNFDQFVQMHKYMQEGDFEAADTIRDELGLDQFGPMRGMGPHKGFHMGHRFNQDEIEE